MSSRKGRAETARETVSILRQGYYVNLSQRKVSVADELQFAVANTLHYRPEDFASVRDEARKILEERAPYETQFQVVNSTTLASIRKHLEDNTGEDVVCLNFASAKNPGGGFLNGSQAQEESLARATGMYSCIAPKQSMYNHNRQCGTCLYTHHALYSPKVPVLRNDEDELLEEPYLTSIITSPAVNAGAVRRRERPLIEPTMRERIENVLALAVAHHHQTVVLGAWGCGVFKNDPTNVAQWLHDALQSERFQGAFRKVIFAVLDRSREERFIGPFLKMFD